ncbi:hypothetical protein ACOME3_002355 [Neoechinorhynchus agilis]
MSAEEWNNKMFFAKSIPIICVVSGSSEDISFLEWVQITMESKAIAYKSTELETISTLNSVQSMNFGAGLSIDQWIRINFCPSSTLKWPLLITIAQSPSENLQQALRAQLGQTNLICFSTSDVRSYAFETVFSNDECVFVYLE